MGVTGVMEKGNTKVKTWEVLVAAIYGAPVRNCIYALKRNNSELIVLVLAFLLL